MSAASQRIPLRFDTEDNVQESPQEELEVRRSDGRNPTYLRLDGFEGDRLEELFDRAVDDELGSPGLILDLRGNYGGVLDHAFRMLGRFYSEPLVIGKHCLPATQGEETSECTVHRIEPRGMTYRGSIAVLINEDVYSAGELAAYALCRGGRARCFGRTTAGETDCVFRLDLPGGVARMSWADFHPAFGPPLVGAGLDGYYLDKNAYLEDYQKIKDALVQKFGRPLEEGMKWRDTSYKDDFSSWGEAVSLGHLELSSRWLTPQTEIKANLSGIDDEILLTVEYSGLELKELAKKSEN